MNNEVAMRSAHNHVPNTITSVNTAKTAVNSMKLIASDIEQSLQVVVATTSHGLSKAARAQLLRFFAIKWTIQRRRVRNRQGGDPANPQTLKDLEFLWAHNQTTDGVPFLLLVQVNKEFYCLQLLEI